MARASAPSRASPTTITSLSSSRSRRRPCRSIVWSSAMRTRIPARGPGSGDGITARDRETNLEPGARRRRFDGQLAAKRADTFHDHARPLQRSVELVQCQTAVERKSTAVVGYLQHAVAKVGPHTHMNRPCTAVSPDVRQRFLKHAKQLDADGWRECGGVELGVERRVNTGLTLKALDNARDIRGQPRGLQIGRMKVLG